MHLSAVLFVHDRYLISTTIAYQLMKVFEPLKNSHTAKIVPSDEMGVA